MRKYISNFSICIASLALTLLLLESLFRILPVNEGLRAQPVNAEQPIYHFEPNRIAQYSHGWDFKIRNTVRLNNYGFVSDNDYDPSSSTPLVAIIGDSYVESQMVQFQETVTGRLQEKIKDKGRVYAFAASGAGLSQHMVWAKYARDIFRPDAFVFVIIGNDFSDSLSTRSSSPGFHRFARDGETGWRMELADYEPSLARRLLRNSMLAMYVLTNVKPRSISQYLASLGSKDEPKRFVGNVESAVDEAYWRDATWAVSIYLNNLPEWAGVRPQRIAFVVDGIRPELYGKSGGADVTPSFWSRIREHFISEAESLGFEVIDMHPRFLRRYTKTKRRFEFPSDNHWNDEGHASAADAVAQGNVWRGMPF